MNIIVVDDETIILDGEIAVIRQCAPDAKVAGFNDPGQALQYAKSHPVDVAFLDVEMPGITGVALAKQLKTITPKINIIFATAYNNYYATAMELHASGYILKPIRAGQVTAELSDLRHPISNYEHGLFIRTFGHFEVFYDNQPVWFKYQKTKELLAYLIDRNGSIVECADLITVLWEGKLDKANYFKQLQKDLKDTLTEYGCGDILVKRRGSLGIIRDRVQCDYYDWIKGVPSGINAYRGEYMTQYSWAEFTRGSLERSESIC